jgi:hypothetical protein
MEELLTRELVRVERLAVAGPGTGNRRIRRQVARIEQGIDRLCALRDDMRSHRENELERLDGHDALERERRAVRSRELRDRERAIDEQARRLGGHADALRYALSGPAVHDRERRNE